MISTRSPACKYSGEAMISTSRFLVCEGAVVRNTVSGIVTGFVLRAYTTGMLNANPVISAGAMPLISAVRILVGLRSLNKRANSWPQASISAGSTW